MQVHVYLYVLPHAHRFNTSLIQYTYSFQLHDDRSVIGKNLFKKETNIQAFVGLKVKLSTGTFEGVGA